MAPLLPSEVMSTGPYACIHDTTAAGHRRLPAVGCTNEAACWCWRPAGTRTKQLAALQCTVEYTRYLLAVAARCWLLV